MKNSSAMIAAALGMAAGAAAVSLATMPKKNKIKAKANKAIKTAGQIVDGISQSMG